MKTVYYPQDDILEIRFNDKTIVRETSQDWNVNVSYAQDGSIVEIAVLEILGETDLPEPLKPVDGLLL